MNKHTAFRIVIIATVIILLMSTSAMVVGESDGALTQPAVSQNRLNTADLISKPLVIPTTIPIFQSPGIGDSQPTESSPTQSPQSEKPDRPSRGLFPREPRTIPILDDPITIPPTVAPTPISTPSSSTGCGCGVSVSMAV